MSGVWDYCQKLTKDEARCNQCQTTLKCKDASTTGLKRHLQRWHGIDCSQERKKKKESCSNNQVQPTIQSFLGSKRNYDKQSPKAQRLNYKLAKMIFLDLQPLSVVEDSGFIELMREADPRYEIPSRNTFRNSIIPTFYLECSQHLKSIINSYRECFGYNSLYSITTDAWTSSNNTSFVTYTIHLVKDFELESYTLSTVELSERHTANNLQAHLLCTLQEWDIFMDFNEGGRSRTVAQCSDEEISDTSDICEGLKTLIFTVNFTDVCYCLI